MELPEMDVDQSNDSRQTRIQPETNVETVAGSNMKLIVVTDKLTEITNNELEIMNVFQDLKDLIFDIDTNYEDSRGKEIKKILENQMKLIEKYVHDLKDIKKSLKNLKKKLTKYSSVVVPSNIVRELEDCTSDDNEEYTTDSDEEYTTDSDEEMINQTFEDIKILEKHLSGDPNIYPVETLDVFPDLENWKKYTKASFSSDPGPKGRPLQVKKKEMSFAVINKEINENGEEIVTYCLPTKKTLKKLCQDIDKNSPYAENSVYKYYVLGEYNCKKKDTDNKYFFTVLPNGAYYNQAETKMSLSERLQKTNAEKSSVNTKRTVYFPGSIVLKSREKQLQPHNELKKNVKEEATNGNLKNNDMDMDNDNSDVSNIRPKRKRKINSKYLE